MLETRIPTKDIFSREISLLWLAMIWMLAIVPIIPVITTPRVFDAEFATYIASGARSIGSLPWVLDKIVIYGVISFCFFVITAYSQRGISKPNHNARNLLLVIVLYSLIPVLVTFVTGEVEVDFALSCLTFVFTATYFLPVIKISELAKQIRIALATIYIYGSILAIIIAPSWAIESGYSTELSYFVTRLHGIAIHSNTLAAYLFIFIVLGWLPNAKIKMEKTNFSLALILILASQSKTIIGILSVLLAMKLYNKYKDHITVEKPIKLLYFLLMPSTLLVAFMYALMNERIMDKFMGADFMTLTGRQVIWVSTYDLWLKRAWFGYGKSMWNNDMQIEYASLFGGYMAPHAHNQFMQTLGESGVVGAILLVIVYFMIGKASWKYYSFTGGVSFYLFIYLFIRSLTELPIISVVNQSNFFNFWVIFAVIVTCHKNFMFCENKPFVDELHRETKPNKLTIYKSIKPI